MSRKPRIGLVGTFDVNNYGDLLFPFIFAEALKSYIPEFELKLFSPRSGLYKIDETEILSVFDLEKYSQDIDAFVIGGGDIIRFDTPPCYAGHRSDLPPYVALWALPSLYGCLESKPVIWNAPGVPLRFSSEQKEIVRRVAMVADYVAVRDRTSKGLLKVAEPRIKVVPDTGFLVSGIIPADRLSTTYGIIATKLGIEGPYIVFHASNATSEIRDESMIANRLAKVSDALGCRILLLPLGPVHGEVDTLERVASHRPTELTVVKENLDPIEIASIIAHARMFIGTSLHGSITAFSYGIPGVVVNNRALPKLYHFGLLTGRPVLHRWEDVPLTVHGCMAADLRAAEEVRRGEIVQLVWTHFEEMARCVSSRKQCQKKRNGDLIGLTRSLIANLLESEKGRQAAVNRATVADPALLQALREQEQKIQALQSQQSGLLWECFIVLRAAKSRWLPPGSKRRALYDSWLLGLKHLKRESPWFVLLCGGLKSPLRLVRNLTGANWKKFIYHCRHSDPRLLRAKVARKLGYKADGRAVVEPSGRKFGLILSGCPGDSFRYRCEHTAEQLRHLGLPVDIADVEQIEYVPAPDRYDWILLHRVPRTKAIVKLIETAKHLNKPVIFDTDDLAFDETKLNYIRALEWMSPNEVESYRQNVIAQRQTLTLCGYATVTNSSLQRAVEECHPEVRCFVLPNSLSETQVAQADAIRQTKRARDVEGVVRIAYFSGTRTHNWDFKECVDALKRALCRYANLRLMIVGHLDLDDEFAEFGARVEKFPLMPWQELPRLLSRVDINLAPLESNNPFTACKSDLKYLEAGIMAVPTIASDIEPFRESIRHGENGFLCRTADDWYSCICRLVEDPIMRRSMGSLAQDDILKNRTIEAATRRLLTVLREICGDHSATLDALDEASGPKAQPVVFKEHELAHKLLDGLVGLEIGAAAHNPFGLRTRNVAIPEVNKFYAEQSRREMAVDPVAIDIAASGDAIPVPDQSEDFIISSHVLEHFPNVIKALVEWNRIVRDGGYIFMIVPIKGALPADATRELTPLEHFLEDYELEVTAEDHPLEGVPGGRMGHYHTFDPESLLGVVDWMAKNGLCDWELIAREDVDSKVGNGFTLVFKVRHSPQLPGDARIDNGEPRSSLHSALRARAAEKGEDSAR